MQTHLDEDTYVPFRTDGLIYHDAGTHDYVAEASWLNESGEYWECVSHQDTVITDGSQGQSLLTGRGAASTVDVEGPELASPYLLHASSYSLVVFTSAHPFEWTFDAKTTLFYDGDSNGSSEVIINFSRDVSGPDERIWNFESQLSKKGERVHQFIGESGRLPAGTYRFVIGALASANEEWTRDLEGHSDIVVAEYEVDLRIKQYPTTDVSRYLSIGKWDRVTDTLLDLDKRDYNWRSDLDGNGTVDVDDVISALKSAIGTSDAMPNAQPPAADQAVLKDSGNTAVSKRAGAGKQTFNLSGK